MKNKKRHMATVELKDPTVIQIANSIKRNSRVTFSDFLRRALRHYYDFQCDRGTIPDQITMLKVEVGILNREIRERAVQYENILRENSDKRAALLEKIHKLEETAKKKNIILETDDVLGAAID